MRGLLSGRLSFLIGSRNRVLPLIDITAMAHTHDGDQLFDIVDQVNNPVITNANAPAFLLTLQLSYAGWTRMLAQGQNALLSLIHI